MDLGLTDHQRMLKDVARDVMQREAPRERLVAWQHTSTGIEPALWRQLAELGWLGLRIPEAYGGQGAGAMDTAVVFEEVGRGPLGGPLFSSAVLGVEWVRALGTPAQQARILPEVAAGTTVLTVAWTEAEYGWRPGAVRLEPERSADGFRLAGRKLFVPDAFAATHFLVAVRTGPHPEDLSALVVPREAPGVRVRPLAGLLRWQAEVTFADVRLPADALLGEENQAARAFEAALDQALPILAAYQVGGSQAVFEMSVEYSRSRVQFGRPIGQFQRVQDHIIRLVNELDAARWVMYDALWRQDTGRPLTAAASMAKAVASAAYWEACNAAHEVHAGIGSDRTFGLTLHTEMSRTLYPYLGDPRYHRARMADALGWPRADTTGAAV
ncbi:MAG: acyl-CoA/acyl-ACP dehydrogenase [Actinomycetia bacterium]|nr:acyl-CoA/acyl-ACP dehydrogenase [Actinomycetes bacterium]